MDSSLLDLLRGVDTPSVCNAIEVAQGKRGFARFTRGTMISSAPAEPAVVGYALTAKIAGLNPPSEPAEVLRERRMQYYRYMASGARPASRNTLPHSVPGRADWSQAMPSASVGRWTLSR